MDARIDVQAALGLAPGDAHVLRNAGGLVTDDVIRSLVISQQVVGTDGILLIQHTRCGLEGADDDAIRAALAEDLGLGPEAPIFDLGTFADADVLVRSQLLQPADAPVAPPRPRPRPPLRRRYRGARAHRLARAFTFLQGALAHAAMRRGRSADVRSGPSASRGASKDHEVEAQYRVRRDRGPARPGPDGRRSR